MLIICLLLTWTPFTYLILYTSNLAWISCSSVCIFWSCSLQVCEERYVTRGESLRRTHKFAISLYVLYACCAWQAVYSRPISGFVSLTQKTFECELVFLGSCRQVCVSYLFLYFLLPAPTYGVVEKQRSGEGMRVELTDRWKLVLPPCL